MKNAVFWDLTQCGSFKSRRFEGTYHLQHQGDKNRRARNIVFLRSVRRLLVKANVAPSSPILVTLIMEALRSSEMSVLTRATWHNIPEDGILHSHRREILKSHLLILVSCHYKQSKYSESLDFWSSFNFGNSK
jgi:hypothetical protein